MTAIRGFLMSGMLLCLLGMANGMDVPLTVEMHELPKGISKYKLSAYCDEWKSQPVILNANQTTTNILRIGQYLKVLSPLQYEQFQETAHSVVRRMDTQQAIQFLRVLVTIPFERQGDFASSCNTLGIHLFKHPSAFKELKRLLLGSDKVHIEDLEYLPVRDLLLEKRREEIIWFLLPKVEIHSQNGSYFFCPEAINTWAPIYQKLLKRSELSDKDRFQKTLFEALKLSLLDRLSPDSKFLQVVTRISYAQNPHAELHSLFAKALLSKGFGVSLPKTRDMEIENISPYLLNLTLQDGLRLFYVLGDFTDLLSSIQQKLSVMTTIQLKPEEVTIALLQMKIITKYE